MKQVIVMRTDLNMRKGKMIAQGAHATMGTILEQDISMEGLASFDQCPTVPLTNDVINWIVAGMKKICVRTDSEEQLLGLHKAATEAGLRAYLVTDAGHTEFNGRPTVTCLAIGPNEDEAVDKITGSLTLL